MTYSIVARCGRTGQLGVGVQTHYLAAGAKVPWIRNAVGAVATQAHTNMTYGAQGLELMAAGVHPQQTLDQLVAADEFANSRQVAMVDAEGRSAAHIGELCVAHASNVIGDGVVFQANLMANAGVPEAMAASWVATEDQELVERILAALFAAQAAGGDLRGQQSAAIQVTMPTGDWWDAFMFDLRVDDHAQPLEELSRLVTVQRSYDLAGIANDLFAGGDVEGATEAYARAKTFRPDSVEMSFWYGAMLANSGDVAAAKRELAIAFADGEKWRELLRRLVASGDFTASDEVLQTLLSS